MKKINISILNSVWQIIPIALSLGLSLMIVRLFSISLWGSLVSLMAIYQIACTLVAWGNKEYLQRAIANQAAEFNFIFSKLWAERLIVLIVVSACIFGFEIVEKKYFLHFFLMFLGRFLYQSFDVIILKEKSFTLSISLELIVLTIQALLLFILFNKNQTVQAEDLLPLFWIPNLLKGIVLSIIFRTHFSFRKLKESPLLLSISFSMISLSGLLHSKIDLLLFSKFLDHASLGKYQIIMTLLWNIQAIAQYISSPFVSNFYRLGISVKNKLSKLLKQMGLLIAFVGITFAFFLLNYFLGISLDWTIYIASIIFCFMSYYYIPIILEINKKKKEHVMLFVNLLGTIFLALSIYMLHLFVQLDFNKAIYFVTLHQLLITSILVLVNNKLSNEQKIF